jgi:hypothetical protein
MLSLGSTNSPSPLPTMTVDPSLVTPGPVGFVAIALVAAAVVLLVWDMQRRIRRVRYRAEIAEQLDAEQAAANSTDEEE